jgi:hypothetical protein
MIEKKTLRSLALNYVKLNKNNKGIDVIGNREYISVESLLKELNNLKLRMAEISFICKDKEIHFGALQVVYVRDAMEEISNLIKELKGK